MRTDFPFVIPIAELILYFFNQIIILIRFKIWKCSKKGVFIEQKNPNQTIGKNQNRIYDKIKCKNLVT